MFQYNPYLNYELEQGLINKRKQLEEVEAELDAVPKFTLVTKRRGSRIYHYANMRIDNKVKSIYVNEADLPVLQNEKIRTDALRVRKSRIKKEIEELDWLLNPKRKKDTVLQTSVLVLLKDEQGRHLKKLEQLQAYIVNALSNNDYEKAKEKKADYDNCFLAIEEINSVLGGVNCYE